MLSPTAAISSRLLVGSCFEAPILSSTGASCVAGSGEQTSAAGFDGAGNEFGPSSATCRGADVLRACALTVTRHTSCAAGNGSCPRDVESVGASSGREHFRLRRRDKASPCSVRVAGASGGREHSRLRRRDKASPCSVRVAGASGGREHSRLRRRDNNSPRGVGDAGVSGGSRSLGVSSGRGAGVGAESRLSASSEARKCRDVSFSSLFARCMSPSQRVAHVSDSVTRLLTTPTRDMHMNSCGSMLGSVMHDNSSRMHVNSCGALGHKNSCHVHAAEVRGGTKSPSMSTRLGVRCPAVEKLASPQQAPGSLHGEVWASILQNQGLRFFREVEIVPGCAVSVACPLCPDHSPVSLGPGRVIRNMLGWSLEEKNVVGSGVWLFRGALQGKIFSSLDVTGDWVRKGSYHTAWSVPCDSWCSCSYAYGHGPAVGPHTGERCWPLLAGVWRAIAPLMKPWCAEGEVPTAANKTEPLPGRELVCWVASR